MSTCFCCGATVVPAYGYGSLTVGQGATSIEQLRNFRQYVLCEDCTAGLLAEIGVPPRRPHREPPPEPPLPEPPFGCHDSRLDLT